ncbi:Methyltransferase type 11 [Geotalea uraniireducens Rf4]|uniref:Methyltransferase type 11 n=2 Tax=Geotalea uraniireducens TaxID=351604 RepID=A5G814_GEOUR|nr:Methyltransferase type 11 [Geotalea uraniireducens Rf4]
MARSHFTEVCGTEVSTTAVQIAKDKYGVEIVGDSLESIDFGDRRFDTVTLFHVLEHVHNPVDVVRKCHALLRDNGMLLIAVPNELESLRRRVRHALNRLGLRQIKYHGLLGIPKIVLDGSLAEIHLSHFTPAVVADLVQRNGFAVVENDLDPYYVKHGPAGLLHAAYYRLMRVLWKLTGKNFYDTIWLVARKQD